MWVPKVLPGLSAVTVRHLSCGDAFAACLSDRGILLTFGSGQHGVLGHRNMDDIEQPKIVEALLGFEIRSVVCGASHVVAITTDSEVYSWGCGGNGRLGSGATLDLNVPRPVVGITPEDHISTVVCGIDSTMFLSSDGPIYACGSNKCAERHK